MASTRTSNEMRRPTKRCGYVHTGMVLTNVLATTEAFDFRECASGQLLIPAGYAANTLTVYVSDVEAGTYLALTQSDGTAVTVTVTASKAIELPVHCFGAHWLKFVQSSDDAAPIKIITKS